MITSDQDMRLRLAAILESFKQLNPDMARRALPEALQLAAALDAEAFAEMAAVAEQVVALFLASPVKHAQQRVLHEYCRHLNSAGGGAAVEAAAADSTMALVSTTAASAVQWFRLLTAAALPPTAQATVEAAKQRGQLCETVIAPMLLILQQLDCAQALQWQLQLLQTSKGKLDPELAHELLLAWAQVAALQLPAAALQWVLQWAQDVHLARQWPSIVEAADHVLRRAALCRWLQENSLQLGQLRYLRRLIERDPGDRRALSRWLRQALHSLGDSVDSFVALSRGHEPAAAWQAAAMERELQRIAALFTPILLLGELILAEPNGAYNLAMALFGLAGSGRQQWDARLEELGIACVRRLFLRSLRQRQPPLAIIEQLTFGDRQLLQRLAGELDLLTKEFDSIAQREKVVRTLGVYYASYREPQLTAAELSRRYRRLMRALHPDSLQRLLSAAQLTALARLETLTELTALAGEARRFLDSRRALDGSLEELLAAEDDFATGVRQRRIRLVRRLL